MNNTLSLNGWKSETETETETEMNGATELNTYEWLCLLRTLFSGEIPNIFWIMNFLSVCFLEQMKRWRSIFSMLNASRLSR